LYQCCELLTGENLALNYEAYAGSVDGARKDQVGAGNGSWRRRIALIAHDNKKEDLVEWASFNRDSLARHELFATGTTGAILAGEVGLEITRFRSGPLGGDQQVGAAIVDGRIDFVIFFWDPLEPHPHDVDVKALLRIAVVYNVPIACNRATADFLISSPLLSRELLPEAFAS
jgi:methylglyoxal synthase